MSSISDIEQSLQRYWQLNHHSDPELLSYFKAVQQWQKQRMQHTHEALFAVKNHTKIASYFLNRLYGGDEFEILARQLERMLPKAKSIEKIVPANAIKTGNFGISLALLAVELDEDVAQYLLSQKLAVTEENMIAAYHACDQREQRIHQMNILSKLCYRLDKYVRSYMLKKAFDLSKRPAYHHNFNALYDFIDEGFQAMKPVKSMKDFVQPFCDAELMLIEQVHEQIPNPFVLQKPVKSKLLGKQDAKMVALSD